MGRAAAGGFFLNKYLFAIVIGIGRFVYLRHAKARLGATQQSAVKPR